MVADRSKNSNFVAPRRARNLSQSAFANFAIWQKSGSQRGRACARLSIRKVGIAKENESREGHISRVAVVNESVSIWRCYRGFWEDVTRRDFDLEIEIDHGKIRSLSRSGLQYMGWTDQTRKENICQRFHGICDECEMTNEPGTLIQISSKGKYQSESKCHDYDNICDSFFNP
jgi:hypothetical protein